MFILYVIMFVVRPTHIELTGSEDHADQGEEVTLTCIVRGAKPAANVTWQNSSEPIQLPVDNKFQEEVSSHGRFIFINDSRKTVILKYNVVTSWLGS